MDLLKFEKMTSDSGIPVYINHFPLADGWFILRPLIYAGYRLDPSGKEGTAHLREHIGIRGILGYPTSAAIRLAWDELFNGTFNALTYQDGTSTHSIIFKKEAHLGVQFLHNFLFHPSLTAEDFTLELETVLTELGSSKKNILNEQVIKQIHQDIFGQNYPVQRLSSLGTWESLHQISLQDLIDFGQHFHKGNIEMIFCGDICPEEACCLTDEFVTDLPAGIRTPRTPVQETSWGPPNPSARTFCEHIMAGLPQPVRYLGALLVRRLLPKLDNAFLLSVLGNMLREIIQDIARDQLGKNYSVEIMHNIQWNWMELGFHLTVKPDFLEVIQKDIVKALELFLDQIFYRDLFERKKKIELNRNRMFLKHPNEIPENAVRNLLFFGQIFSAEKILQDINQICFEDIQKIMVEEFLPFAHWVTFVP